MTDRAEIRRIQEEELKALKAIYLDELDDCRGSKVPSPKSQWKPVEVKIKVLPHANKPEQIHVSCSLHISCGPNYPDTVPQQLNIVDCRGLSDSLKQELLDKLQVIAYKSKGSVVIYSLIDCTKEFLTDHNEPSPTSFYDQMVNNRLRIAEEEEKRRTIEMGMAKLRDETTSKHIQEEIYRKQIVLRQESRLRRESCIDDIMPPSPRKSLYMSHDDGQSTQPVCSGHKPVRLKLEILGENRETNVTRGNCVLHDTCNNSIHYIAMIDESGVNCLLTEWIVSWTSIDISPNFVYNSFKSCEKEITATMMKLQHPNLIAPLAFGFSLEKERSYLRLLNPLVNGCRLCDLPSILRGDKLEDVQIKRVMSDILSGLSYLDKQDLTHGDLRDTVIIIDSRDGTCRLSNFHVDAQIRNLQSTITNHNSESKFNEIEDGDIYRFGLILMWLSTGWAHSFNHLMSMTSNELINSYIISFDLTQEIADLISKCLRVNIFNDIDEIWSHSFFYHPVRSRSNTETRCPLVAHSSRRAHSSPMVDMKDEESEKSSKQLLASLMVSSETLGSRLTDYEILNKLGSGGFGEVYMVRNKLDQCCYALKKIPIKVSNVNINRKIIHEVKYLSRLNHENVVRYYGTWIERENQVKRNDSLESDVTTDTTIIRKHQEAGDGEGKGTSDEDSSEDEFSDHELFSSSRLNFQQASLSESYIVYERQSGDEPPAEESTPESAKVVKRQTSNERRPGRHTHVMYIQMELCSKNTLRSAIDTKGLTLNHARRRRLFREIVDGLVHIHEHNIIHRDLKPGNIFLDSQDHVKIGDFGLATKTEIVLSSEGFDSLESVSGGLGSGGQSGLVGTFLYMAPELQFKKSPGSKITYTQKVDIYSLGVILFEMCYPPTETKSERIKVLSDIREPDIKFPDDVNDYLSSDEIVLTRLLLNHDVNERPTSDELLISPFLPPPQIEEEEQKNVIREVVFNPQSKTYHYMINLLFKQESDLVNDIIYDFNEEVAHRDPNKKAFADPVNRQRAFEYVTSTLTNIFQRYGAIRFAVPTFTPSLSTKQYKTTELFRVMDGTGNVVCPPYDLRVPFARYIARNKISNLRRYSIEKVYRGRKMSYHPKEIYECAFDIVSAKSNHATAIMSEFELINLLNDILQEFNCLKGRTFYLRLNHVDLLRGLLIYYEVPEEKHSLAMEIIAESIDKSLKLTHSKEVGDDEGTTIITLSKSFLVKRFRQEDITKTSKLNNLLKILEQEKETIEDLKTYLHLLLRKQQPHNLRGLDLINQSIDEMESITANLLACNVNLSFKLKFSPIMLTRYYSGLIFQLEEESSRKNVRNIIALGGRYDDLITKFNMPKANDDFDKTVPVAVGLSLGVEQLSRFVIEDENKSVSTLAGICDVIIYQSESDENLDKDTNRVTRELRSNGIRVIPFAEDSFNSVDQLNNYCEDNRVKYSVVLNLIKENVNNANNKDGNILGVRIFHIEKERRISEKRMGRMTTCELVEAIKLYVGGFKDSSSGSSQFSGDNFTFQRSDSSSSRGNTFQANSSDYSNALHVNSSFFNSLSVNVRFFPLENKVMANHKKRFQTNINNLIASTLSSFCAFNNSTLEVFALDIPFKVVKSIVGDLDFGDSNNPTTNRLTFESSCKTIIEKHPKYRAYLKDVFEDLYVHRVEKKSSIITLIGYNQMQLIIFT